MENTNKKIDYFEDLMFHPSLDIKNKILVLGFRIKPEKDKEANIFFIASEKSVQITSENFFAIDGISYQINTKNRKPSKLSKQWSIEELQKTYDAISKGIPSFEIVKTKEVFSKLKELIKKAK